MSPINSCVVAHQFAIGISLTQLGVSATSPLSIYNITFASIVPFIVLYLSMKAALAQMENESRTIGSNSETKYLSLIQELQKHVSSFQDSARETQRELEAVRTEFAAMKKEVEVNSRPSLQGQEWEDEVGSMTCCYILIQSSAPSHAKINTATVQLL